LVRFYGGGGGGGGGVYLQLTKPVTQRLVLVPSPVWDSWPDVCFLWHLRYAEGLRDQVMAHLKIDSSVPLYCEAHLTFKISARTSKKTHSFSVKNTSWMFRETNCRIFWKRNGTHKYILWANT
jgi:hypothetical protein